MKRLLCPLAIVFTTTLFGQTENKKELSDFLPRGYVIFEKTKGDLNKDGQEDDVLIIKKKDKSKIVKAENGAELDRNRRGIIVLFNKKGQYELMAKNEDCFSSENEDGGVYFPPELSISVEKANLYIHYAHGRYGYWRYTFSFRNGDFELIGYDASSNRGPVIMTETSINFLTRKKKTRENINQKAEQESGEENFKETWTTIKAIKRIRLSDVKDFDELGLSF